MAARRSRDLQALKGQWLALCGLAAVVLSVGYLALRRNWTADLASSWLVASAAVLGYQLLVLFYDLDKNVSSKTSKLLSRFGPGMWLSALRLIGLGLLAGFLVTPRLAENLAWAPFALALFFNLADLLDGYLARRSRTMTELGQKLDLDLDGRGMLIASLLAVKFGMVGWWFVAAGLARYAYVGALWLRKRQGLRSNALKPNPLRRPFAGVEMGFATAMMAPILSPIATNFAATLTLLPFLGNFLYDWLQVTRGRRAPSIRQRAAAKSAADVAALLARAAGCLLLVARITILGTASSFLVFESLATFCFLLGIAGRPVALLALITIAVGMQASVPRPSDFALLFVCTALLYVGTGPLSLWRPEQSIISRRLGESG